MRLSLARTWLNALGLAFPLISLVTGLVSIGQASDEQTGFYCQLTKSVESWSRCDGFAVANLLVVAVELLALTWMVFGDAHSHHRRQNVAIKLLFELVEGVLLMVMVAYLGEARPSSGTILATTAMAMLALIVTGVRLVDDGYRVFCAEEADDAQEAEAAGWKPTDVLQRLCFVLMLIFPISNILVLTTGHHIWNETSSWCILGPDHISAVTCTVGWVASGLQVISVVLLVSLLATLDGIKKGLRYDVLGVTCLVLSILSLILQFAAAILSSKNFASSWTSPVNFRDGKTRYGALSVILFSWVQVVAWLLLGMPLLLRVSARHPWTIWKRLRSYYESLVEGRSTVSRSVLLMTTMITVATFYDSSGQGFSTVTGYFCLVSGVRSGGDFALCGGMLAMSILALLLSILALITWVTCMLRKELESPAVRYLLPVCDVSSFVLLVLLFTLQVSGFVGSPDTRISGDLKASMAFSFLGAVCCLVNLACHGYKLPDQLHRNFPTQRVSKLSTVMACLVASAILGMSISNIVILTSQGVTLNGTAVSCIFGEDAMLRGNCSLATVASSLSCAASIILLFMPFRVQRGLWSGIVLVASSVVILSLHLAAGILTANAMNTALDLPQAFLVLDGYHRYGMGSVVVFSWIQTVLWFGFLGIGLSLMVTHGRMTEDTPTVGKHPHPFVWITQCCTLALSAVVLSLLLHVRYRTQDSTEDNNNNMTFIHSMNSSEWQFVSVTMILSLLVDVLLLVLMCENCLKRSASYTALTRYRISYILSAGLCILLLTASIVQSTEFHGRGSQAHHPAAIVAAVLSYVVTIITYTTTASLFYHGERPTSAASQTSAGTGSVANWKLLLLFLVLCCSLTVLCCAKVQEWPGTGTDIYTGIQMQHTSIAVSSLSVAFSILISTGIVCGWNATWGSQLAPTMATLQAPAWLGVAITNAWFWWQAYPARRGLFENDAALATTMACFAAAILWLSFCIVCAVCDKQLPPVEADSNGDQIDEGQQSSSIIRRAAGSISRNLPRAPDHGQCPMKDCQKFLEEVLGLDTKRLPFKPARNVCFCAECKERTTPSWKLCFARQEDKEFPQAEGWCKFALDIETLIRRYDNEHAQLTAQTGAVWPVAYHGTGCNKVASILETGRLLKPGEVAASGSTVQPLPGHFTATRQPLMAPGRQFDHQRIFLSQDLIYSAAYCTHSNGDTPQQRTHRVVLQARVNPYKLVTFHETLGGRVQNLSVPEDAMEWIVNDGRDALICGLLVKPNEQFVASYQLVPGL